MVSAFDPLEPRVTDVTYKLIAQLDDWWVPEQTADRGEVALVTVAGVLKSTVDTAVQPLRTLDGLTREQVRDAILDAVSHPVLDERHHGRAPDAPLCFAKMVVCLEQPPHFHVALKLNRRTLLMPLKRDLRLRSGLASHWSVTHTMFWSACRYGAMVTERQPTVDPAPRTWTGDGPPLDLYAECQEPCMAAAVRKKA